MPALGSQGLQAAKLIASLAAYPFTIVFFGGTHLIAQILSLPPLRPEGFTGRVMIRYSVLTSLSVALVISGWCYPLEREFTAWIGWRGWLGVAAVSWMLWAVGIYLGMVTLKRLIACRD